MKEEIPAYFITRGCLQNMFAVPAGRGNACVQQPFLIRFLGDPACQDQELAHSGGPAIFLEIDGAAGSGGEPANLSPPGASGSTGELSQVILKSALDFDIEAPVVGGRVANRVVQNSDPRVRSRAWHMQACCAHLGGNAGPNRRLGGHPLRQGSPKAIQVQAECPTESREFG